MDKSLILCSCSESFELDAEALSQATGLTCSKVHSGLCSTQTQEAAQAISAGDTIFCCSQEQVFFEELAAEIDAPTPAFLDLRDRAGWSSDETSKLPKMSALVAEATLPAVATKAVDVVSEGLCLIIGKGDVALVAADQLKDFLAVSVLLTDDISPPDSRDYDALRGHLKLAKGALGQFELRIDALQQPVLDGRGERSWGTARNGATSHCDIILDLSGDTSLFPAPHKREGYLRADPGSIPAVSSAILEASHLVGTFEKPLYVKLQPLLCAHSRAEQIGCSNCLDNCPTGAITPKGDHVSIDPMICAGCGTCSALCPSGAISYDAPPVDLTFRRVQTLAKAYLAAGGEAPRLLVVNGHGSEMIRLSARHGPGIPADVIPLEVAALNGFGHAEILAALAAGFAKVIILPGPTTERTPMDKEISLALAIALREAVELIDTVDPDALSKALYMIPAPAPVREPVRPMGTRRQVTRMAAKALNPEAETIALPEDAPYGAVLVNTDDCTLCLSCVSLCPSGALGDNPDLPQLRFQEDACLQCGLCSTVCPENAIACEPQLNLTQSALDQVVLNEEEPFACVECGALFGVKSTVEKITEQLAGKHAMFAKPEAARMIQMCDDCRVNTQFHSENNPFEGGERPRPRTTDDYLSKRRDH